MKSFGDFYPNYQILAVIEKQLNALGLCFKFIVENYGVRDAISHYRLALRKTPIPNPLLFYKNEVKQFMSNSCERFSFFDLLIKYQSTSDVAMRKKMAIHMDSFLISNGHYVPLLKIPGIYLKNPSIKNEQLFTSGQLWYRQI